MPTFVPLRYRLLLPMFTPFGMATVPALIVIASPTASPSTVVPVIDSPVITAVVPSNVNSVFCPAGIVTALPPAILSIVTAKPPVVLLRTTQIPPTPDGTR